MVADAQLFCHLHAVRTANADPKPRDLDLAIGNTLKSRYPTAHTYSRQVPQA